MCSAQMLELRNKLLSLNCNTCKFINNYYALLSKYLSKYCMVESFLVFKIYFALAKRQ